METPFVEKRACVAVWVQIGMSHGTQALVGSVEGFVGKAGVLPLHFAGGGPEVGVRAGREGAVPGDDADPGELHGVPGASILSDEQTKYCVPTLKCCSFGA